MTSLLEKLNAGRAVSQTTHLQSLYQILTLDIEVVNFCSEVPSYELQYLDAFLVTQTLV